MGTQATKIDKKLWFDAHFRNARNSGISLDKEKLMALFILEQNSSRRTALELLKAFELTGQIKFKKFEGNIEILINGVNYLNNLSENQKTLEIKA